ncbi:hypothetical protein CEXT_66261 [Caerostris extrusa]|uniref:BPTI/Kunitz inhibitor domain-containing protein n=1 Tax=Caerostris extrusa TaxID=172846 RepID=A0AAV4RXE2_CAEEX|nr:hypothetical protein CEXT_66261 [Caerostris extrusa]
MFSALPSSDYSGTSFCYSRDARRPLWRNVCGTGITGTFAGDPSWCQRKCIKVSAYRMTKALGKHCCNTSSRLFLDQRKVLNKLV